MHLALECHLVSQQLDVSIVNSDTILAHGELDLIYNALSGSLYAKHVSQL